MFPLAQLHQKAKIKINFKTPQKLASYINEDINLKWGACEILDCKEASTAQEHTKTEMSWMHMMHR